MRIGIVGAGQLGRMMALSGVPLGLEFAMYDTRADVPGAAVAEIFAGAFDDRKKLARFARAVDVVTFDWENVPVASARAIAAIRPVWPPPRALEIAQDRVSEKRLFRRLGIPVAPFATVDSTADLARAIAALGAPGILKTRRLGYDGKGQVRIRRAGEAAQAFEQLAGQPLVYERLVNFSREVSLVGGARPGRDGPALPARRERARGGNPRRHARALGRRQAAAPGGTESPAADARARLCRRAVRRVLRRARPPGRERNGAARAQLRPLDHRGRRDQPVREPRARDRRPAARQPACRAATP